MAIRARIGFKLALVVFAGLMLSVASVRAQSNDWTPVSLSDSLGSEIGPEQRTAYHLFPDIDRFVSARFFTRNGQSYRLEYSYQATDGTTRVRIKRITNSAWELTHAHVAIVELGKRRQTLPLPTNQPESEIQYRMALKSAAAGQYEVSRTILNDLLTSYPGTPAANDAATIQPDIIRLSQARRVLFLPGGLLDQSGRTDVMIFSGYYGLWAGIAIPVCLNARSSEWYALGLITGAPGGLLLTNHLTRDAELGRGRASVIKLGGHLGTWQGLGWASLADWDGRGVVAAGLVGGLAGITGATLLSKSVYFSEGHGALMGSAVNWGMWFGFATGTTIGLDGNDLLRATLIGSDVLVVTAGIAARNVQMSRGRERMISLMGLVGTVAGFGVDVLVRAGDEHVAMGIAELGGIGGLILGAKMTRNYDAGKDLAATDTDSNGMRCSVTPRLIFARSSGGTRTLTPMAGFQFSFP